MSIRGALLSAPSQTLRKVRPRPASLMRTPWHGVFVWVHASTATGSCGQELCAGRVRWPRLVIFIATVSLLASHCLLFSVRCGLNLTRVREAA